MPLTLFNHYLKPKPRQHANNLSRRPAERTPLYRKEILLFGLIIIDVRRANFPITLKCAKAFKRVKICPISDSRQLSLLFQQAFIKHLRRFFYTFGTAFFNTGQSNRRCAYTQLDYFLSARRERCDLIERPLAPITPPIVITAKNTLSKKHGRCRVYANLSIKFLNIAGTPIA